jgi:hypothetical protein
MLITLKRNKRARDGVNLLPIIVNLKIECLRFISIQATSREKCFFVKGTFDLVVYPGKVVGIFDV